MPDPCKALGKYMELETTYEFLGRERHLCSLSALSVVLQTKGHCPFLLVYVKDTVVADEHLKNECHIHYKYN